MSQIWDPAAPSPSQEWDYSLNATKDKLDSVQSNFSGTGAPPSPVVGMGWSDTTKQTNKRRNFANNAWLADIHGDADFMLWLYRNDTNPGMVIDPTVSDVVLAAKGGTTYVTGGTLAGTWAQTSNTWSTSGPSATEPVTGGVSNVASSSHSHTVTAGANAGVWRPAAAVGTMQKPDL